jgi:hypothetical protein
MLRDQAFAATLDSASSTEELSSWAARACESFVSAPPLFYGLRRNHATAAEVAGLLRKTLTKRNRSVPDGSAWIQVLNPTEYEAAVSKLRPEQFAAATACASAVACEVPDPSSPVGAEVAAASDGAAACDTPVCGMRYAPTLLGPKFAEESQRLLLALRAQLVAGAAEAAGALAA